MVLYKPLLLDDIKKTTAKALVNFVEGKEGKFVEVDSLGKLLLAYPIKKFEEGHYIEYELTCSASAVKEFEQELILSDNVLRYLILKK